MTPNKNYGRKEFEVCKTVADDQGRRVANELLLSKMEWDYHELQRHFMEQICQSKRSYGSDRYTWLTALVNDDYVPAAIVLGHSIRTLSCVKNMMVLVTDEVSFFGRDALARVGWDVRVVEKLDCRWMDKHLSNVAPSKGIIGTYTRFHAWNYTQFSKIIYADPDYMLLSNIDELFEETADFAATYCSRPGVIDPCFNAGLLVFKPDSKQHQSIMDLWEKISREESCPSDQELLWYYFANTGKWKPLSYAYNVRRIIYRPMKAFHFACCPPPKPWKEKCRPSRGEAMLYDQPITNLKEVSIVFWKCFYEALSVYNIDRWWKSTKYFNPDLEFGNIPYENCWNKNY
ncbi:glycogenin-1-like isoform X1 [Actinia tenebrosa]|uniref:glycogenin glucosyltransferase n=2 Tax=Actinia tenebrosa TaxID=6105 RepID=A0A6P8I3C6_ACTTE|nr:glycogenin-1-like isoform X1 [Actinia tenebrosa]XP_031559402.1 glycogenin-1-like isoform X1 [Actinia tenebrosa]